MLKVFVGDNSIYLFFDIYWISLYVFFRSGLKGLFILFRFDVVVDIVNVYIY